MKPILIFALAAFSFTAKLPGDALATPQDTTLRLAQALQLAEKSSPGLKAARARETEAGESVQATQSALLPSLDLSAVDSMGFPGSAAGLDGFSGIVTSPFRKGPAADAFVKWNLIDLSAWHAVAASQYQLAASRQETRLKQIQIDEQTLILYLEAVLNRGNADAWQKLSGDLKGVSDTVARFVRNGQYSEVQSILIQNQLDEAVRKQQDYQHKYQAVLQRLGILTDLEPEKISCPAPSDISEDALQEYKENSQNSPLVERATALSKAAEENEKNFSSKNLPRLETGGSAGYLSETRLEPGQDYSAFVGITLPIFEGFKISAEEKKAANEAAARKNDLDEAMLAVRDFNIKYSAQIEEYRADLQVLLPEKDHAAKAVALAKSRYLSFLGPLSDLQQAWKDMIAIDNQIAEVKTQLLLALGFKALVNGAGIQANL